MELRDVLGALVVPSTGLSALIAWWLIDRIKEWLWPAPGWRPGKAALRWLALIVASLIAVLAYLGEIGMGYVAEPATWRAWIEALFAVGSGAFGASQIWQAHMSDRSKAAH